MISECCEVRSISGKQICIVDNHHEVILPWAKLRNDNITVPILITLDHHTDTHRAFLVYMNKTYGYYNEFEANKILSTVSINDPGSIKGVLSLLLNDEHIDLTVKKEIIKESYSIQFDSNIAFPCPNEIKIFQEDNAVDILLGKEIDWPKRPYTYPACLIYIVGDSYECPYGKSTHNEECDINHYNDAIESVHLGEKLSQISEINSQIIKSGKVIADYILDIDLDYFHTRRSINPENHDVFYEMIRGASLITIAREADYVKNRRTYRHDSEITSEYLFEKIMLHIHNALN